MTRFESSNCMYWKFSAGSNYSLKELWSHPPRRHTRRLLRHTLTRFKTWLIDSFGCKWGACRDVFFKQHTYYSEGVVAHHARSRSINESIVFKKKIKKFRTKFVVVHFIFSLIGTSSSSTSFFLQQFFFSTTLRRMC